MFNRTVTMLTVGINRQYFVCGKYEFHTIGKKNKLDNSLVKNDSGKNRSGNAA